LQAQDGRNGNHDDQQQESKVLKLAQPVGPVTDVLMGNAAAL
jgi:hypothetical protein